MDITELFIILIYIVFVTIQTEQNEIRNPEPVAPQQATVAKVNALLI